MVEQRETAYPIGAVCGTQDAEILSTSSRLYAKNIPTAASAITAVASQPKTLSSGVRQNSPITFRRAARSIITTMMGGETMPLITADQKSALSGSRCRKFNTTPPIVAIATTR